MDFHALKINKQQQYVTLLRILFYSERKIGYCRPMLLIVQLKKIHYLNHLPLNLSDCQKEQFYKISQTSTSYYKHIFIFKCKRLMEYKLSYVSFPTNPFVFFLFFYINIDVVLQTCTLRENSVFSHESVSLIVPSVTMCGWGLDCDCIT